MHSVGAGTVLKGVNGTFHVGLDDGIDRVQEGCGWGGLAHNLAR